MGMTSFGVRGLAPPFCFYQYSLYTIRLWRSINYAIYLIADIPPQSFMLRAEQGWHVIQWEILQCQRLIAITGQFTAPHREFHTNANAVCMIAIWVGHVRISVDPNQLVHLNIETRFFPYLSDSRFLHRFPPAQSHLRGIPKARFHCAFAAAPHPPDCGCSRPLRSG